MSEYRLFSQKGNLICARDTGEEAVAFARSTFPKMPLGYIEKWECAHIMPVEWFMYLSEHAKASESPADERDGTAALPSSPSIPHQ